MSLYRRVTAAFSICVFAAGFNAACAKPERIVSLSLCTDELVLRLADRERIASLSYLAADPAFSSLAEKTPGLRLNHGRAEEVIPLNPDLVLGTRFSAGTAVNLLDRLDYPVTTLGFPASLDEVYVQIAEVADLLGERDRGEALIRSMQEQIDALLEQLPADTEDKSALFYANNGFSFGAGTLRDSFLHTLGLKNLAAESGIVGNGRIPLETLIAARPDYLLIDSPRADANYLALPLLSHPALRKTFSTGSLLVLPDRLFQCAGPNLVEAFRLMVKALAQS